jgi:thymidine kinase
MGSLTVFCGPMFASKTTRLLAAMERESYRCTAADSILLIKHSVDSRHGDLSVGTHHGLIRHATRVASRLLDVDVSATTESVFVDEGQFFEDLAPFCLACLDRGIRVYVSCLDLDKDRKPWESVAATLCFATKVEKCSAVCHCKRDALYSSLLSNSL